jgi:hypothetical protein
MMKTMPRAEHSIVAKSLSPRKKGGAVTEMLHSHAHPRRTPHMPILIPTHKRREIIGLDTPFSRDQLLPSKREPFIPWTGSRRLLLGVLQDALRSFFQHRSARSRLGKRAFREAQAWIWAEDQEWLYSFENICFHLHLDPEYIRQGLQQHLQVAQTAEDRKEHQRRSFFSAHRRRPFHLMAGPGTRIASNPQRSAPRKRTKSAKR